MCSFLILGCGVDIGVIDFGCYEVWMMVWYVVESVFRFVRNYLGLLLFFWLFDFWLVVVCVSVVEKYEEVLLRFLWMCVSFVC